MGEKEIKPAGGPQGPVIATNPGPAIQASGGHTVERPGTGTVNPKPEKPTPGPTPSGAGGGAGRPWSGSDRYPDGYRMSRTESGDFTLDNPDGTKATWDAGSESWKGADGKQMPGDWSGGHRPARSETGPGN